MAISKIILNGVTQMDLTSDTVAASNLIAPNTAHGADGEAIVGTASAASEPNLQAKTNVTPIESSQTITADSGYDGLSSVQINAISNTYVGTQVPRFTLNGQDWIVTPTTSQQLIVANGELVEGGNIYVGAMPTMTLPTSASSSSSGTSKATITPGTSAKYINIPTGYNGTASYYTISGVTYSTIRTGTSTPASSLGVNGDIYIKTS